MTQPTPEELEICRRLPPHEFEVGDWAIVNGQPLLVSYGGFENGNFQKMLEDGDIDCWLPHPHQIMALECWPIDWMLKKDPEQAWNWSIVDEKGVYQDSADTVRLACLRAIAPLLEEQP